MKQSALIILSFFSVVKADLLRGSFNESVTGTCSYSSTCTASGVEGVCVSESDGCCSGGTFTSGLCSGSNDIMCCTNPTCSTPYGTGTCQTTSSCSGDDYSGYCAGPTDMQCCVGGSDVNDDTGDDRSDDSSPSGTVYGVDVSSTVSTSTASCLKSDGVSLIIPRAFHSTGTVDTSSCSTLKNAKTEGIAYRDVYMFPCPTCSSSAKSQLSTMTSYLVTNCNSSWSGRVWLDIEGSEYWLGSSSSNQAWYQSLVDACTSSGYSCGVYGSKYQWEDLFGTSTYSYGSELPLWYAHYDDVASFSDYSTYSFGGWSSPTMKQYNGDITECSQGVDKNYAVF
mmetsp:Transcript_11935/g.14442  ORF Transcript_11935/g.14442 Transcript_11935/m.14442 type:complete len:338 (+) Transcript_11935:27-1040(+)|eukprot:CAMPEP_0114365670 /NCGR_PEP_ID=MMETSP0101-20121206/28594_1 /TAXON_ID=38822 ORGANISM="Pteridomonas danica, Strain PT" /NCGR_SAMPLE_ID=MMETSP0101 /ASSEMBLY_ACC=CAM_ASM_000211 /LENGTH=337 /DNA_ID=CAMNT_0001514135 /DNA_START=28 /DNA_END=1041 /DNA_ORIENTATION=-